MKRLSSRAKTLRLPTQSRPDSSQPSHGPPRNRIRSRPPSRQLDLKRCQINQNINKFWKLVGDTIGTELAGRDYPTRLSLLLEHRIGLWDVIATAHRAGSLDSEIRQHTQNDLLALISSLPELNTIAFNGGTAARIGLKTLGEQVADFRVLLLPSSSPAYAALSYEKKLSSWRALAT